MNEIKIAKWEDFRTFVDESRSDYPFYWRGQFDPDWPLASAFERRILGMPGHLPPGIHTTSKFPRPLNIYPYEGRFKAWERDSYSSMRDKYLKAFQATASGLRGPNPAQLNEDQWWALGRHYGLITPFLDWSRKPYIAVFFALHELFNVMRKGSTALASEDREVAIYRLLHDPSLEGDGLRVVELTVEELGRIHGQRGLFTSLVCEEIFELEGFLDHKGKGNLLTRVLLSDQTLLQGLKDLANHGIDYRSIYPDLAGAALEANYRSDPYFGNWGGV